MEVKVKRSDGGKRTHEKAFSLRPASFSVQEVDSGTTSGPNLALSLCLTGFG